MDGLRPKKSSSPTLMLCIQGKGGGGGGGIINNACCGGLFIFFALFSSNYNQHYNLAIFAKHGTTTPPPCSLGLHKIPKKVLDGLQKENERERIQAMMYG